MERWMIAGVSHLSVDCLWLLLLLELLLVLDFPYHEWQPKACRQVRT